MRCHPLWFIVANSLRLQRLLYSLAMQADWQWLFDFLTGVNGPGHT
jgi:hypothetical protein